MPSIVRVEVPWMLTSPCRSASFRVKLAVLERSMVSPLPRIVSPATTKAEPTAFMVRPVSVMSSEPTVPATDARVTEDAAPASSVARFRAVGSAPPQFAAVSQVASVFWS